MQSFREGLALLCQEFEEPIDEDTLAREFVARRDIWGVHQDRTSMELAVERLGQLHTVLQCEKAVERYGEVAFLFPPNEDKRRSKNGYDLIQKDGRTKRVIIEEGGMQAGGVDTILGVGETPVLVDTCLQRSNNLRRLVQPENIGVKKEPFEEMFRRKVGLVLVVARDYAALAQERGKLQHPPAVYTFAKNNRYHAIVPAMEEHACWKERAKDIVTSAWS